MKGWEMAVDWLSIVPIFISCLWCWRMDGINKKQGTSWRMTPLECCFMGIALLFAALGNGFHLSRCHKVDTINHIPPLALMIVCALSGSIIVLGSVALAFNNWFEGKHINAARPSDYDI